MPEAMPEFSPGVLYRRYQQAISEVKLDGAALDTDTDQQLEATVLKIAAKILEGFNGRFDVDAYEIAEQDLDVLEEWQKGSYLRLAQVIATLKFIYPYYRDHWHAQAITDARAEGKDVNT